MFCYKVTYSIDDYTTSSIDVSIPHKSFDKAARAARSRLDAMYKKFPHVSIEIFSVTFL